MLDEPLLPRAGCAMAAGLLLLLALAGCSACFPPPPRVIAPVDASRPQPVEPACIPGLDFCDGRAAYTCSDEGEVELVDVCTDTEVCVDAACQPNQVCTAGERHCVGNALYVCRDDGTGYRVQECGDLICADGECIDPGQLFCVPNAWQCDGNAAVQCNEDGTGWAGPREPCTEAICIDGSCVEVICVPGVAVCEGDTARTCNGLGTGYTEEERCAYPEVCIDGRCQQQVCPAERFCDGDTAVTCNAQLTQEILRLFCGAAGCRDGVCLGRDAAAAPDRAPPQDAGARDLPQLDLWMPDHAGADRMRPDRAADDLVSVDTAGTDRAGPDGGQRDRPLADIQSSCLEVACVGFTWCDPASGQCRPGCGADRQCPPDQRCDLVSHACTPLDAGGRDVAVGVDLGGGGDGGSVAVDGSGVYTPDGGGPIVEELCPASQIVPPGCLAEMDEGEAWLCDGLDNDCDGSVDEGCPCRRGEVQRCFRGPPGRHNVGACEDGLQTCVSPITSPMPTPVWGPCLGGIAPTAEVCDNLDNDCNGCTDEIEDCDVEGACPGPGDPRVPVGRPFSSYPLDGAEFYQGDDAVAWAWSVTGTPCDRMFLDIPGSVATPTNGQLSFTLHSASEREASIDFTLSGDYTVTLDVTRASGEHFSCTWIVHVRAPGLRVELCWDVTGPTASRYGGSLDLDLHLGKTGLTPAWFASSDCDYMSCQMPSSLHSVWGYPSSPIENCTGPGSRSSFYGSCPNPRLDIDNIYETTEYVPENINLDNPRHGDRFRVMVHHYDFDDRAAHPLVNVYCGGELHGTYGAAPDLVDDFDEGGGRNEGSMWRVVDIVMEVDAQGLTTDCDLTPLIDPESLGYFVTADDSRY